MKAKYAIAPMMAMVMSFAILAGCSSPQSQSSSQETETSSSQAASSGDTSSSSDAASDDDNISQTNSSTDQQNSDQGDESNGQGFASNVSDDYLNEIRSLISANNSKEDQITVLRKLNHLERIIEILPNDEGFVVSSDLEKGSEASASVSYAKDAKIYLNGKLASPKDIKVGYLVSYYGGTTAESYPAQVDGATLINAWTANQG